MTGYTLMDRQQEVIIIVTTRPRNRKVLIQAAAAELFRDRGYHDVSVADVTEAVGITASALYRHYHGKQELLLSAIDHVVDQAEAVYGAGPDLDTALRAMAALTVKQGGTAALWQREFRHLDDSQRAHIVARGTDQARLIQRLVRAERPELSRPDTVLISLALAGLFSIEFDRRPSLGVRRTEDLLYRMARAVAGITLGIPERLSLETPPSVDAAHSAAGLRMPRRDLLFNAGVQLFDEHGFQSVGLGDIAEAAGIVRSGAYRYYANKTEILVAATTMAMDRLRMETANALSRAEEPGDALRLLIEAHVRVVIDHAQLLGLVIHDRRELPPEDRVRADRFLDDYMDMWMQALGQIGDIENPNEARTAIVATQAMIQFATRWGPERRRGDLAERLVELAIAAISVAVDLPDPRASISARK